MFFKILSSFWTRQYDYAIVEDSVIYTFVFLKKQCKGSH